MQKTITLLKCLLITFTRFQMWNCTCKPDLHQIQRVKHQRGHHTSTQTGEQVFDPDMTEDLLSMAAYWQDRTGLSGLFRLRYINDIVIRSWAHITCSCRLTLAMITSVTNALVFFSVAVLVVFLKKAKFYEQVEVTNWWPLILRLE